MSMPAAAPLQAPSASPTGDVTSSEKTRVRTLALLLRLVRFVPGLFALNIVAWTVFYTLPLANGLIVQQFFDALGGRVATFGPYALSVWVLLGLLLAAGFGRMLAFAGCFVLYATFEYTIYAVLRKNLFGWLMHGPGSRALPGSPGEAVSRFRDDVEEIFEWLDVLLDFTSNVVFATAAVVVMYRISPLLTLVVLLPLLIAALVVTTIGGTIRRFRRASRAATSRVTSFIGELFGAVQAVKIASAEESVVDEFRRLNAVRRKAALKDNLFTEVIDTFNQNMSQLATGVMLLLVAQSLRNGAFTVGDFALFTSYLGWITFFPRLGSRLLTRHQRASVSFERMARLLKDAPPPKIVEGGPVYLDELISNLVEISRKEVYPPRA